MNSVFNMLMMAGGRPVPPTPQGPMLSGTRSDLYDIEFSVTEHNDTVHNVTIDYNYGSSWEWDNPDGWNIKSIKFTDTGEYSDTITLSGDWSTVTDVSNMFNGVGHYSTNLDIIINDIDTSHVTSTYKMFSDTINIINIDARGLDTSNVTDMRSMFFRCSRLKYVDITGIDTSRVTDMTEMFCSSSNIEMIKGIESIDVSRVTSFSGMFLSCILLTQNNGAMVLNEWRPDSATTFANMFHNCYNLTYISLFDGQAGHPLYRNVTDINNMFRECARAEQIIVTGITIENDTTNIIGTFCNCTSLYFIKMEDFVTTQVTGAGWWADFLKNVQATIIYKGSQWNQRIVQEFPNNTWQSIG